MMNEVLNTKVDVVLTSATVALAIMANADLPIILACAFWVIRITFVFIDRRKQSKIEKHPEK